MEHNNQPLHHQEQVVPPATANDLIKGALFFNNGVVAPWVQVHGSQGVEACSKEISAHIPAGVTFGLILDGGVSFYLDDKHHLFSACERPYFFCYNLLQPTTFIKQLTKGHCSNKVVVTVPQDLLQKLLPQQTPLLTQFLTTHLQLVHGNARPAFIDVAEALLALNNSSNKPLPNDAQVLSCDTQTLLRDAKALEFLSQALQQFNYLGSSSRPYTIANAIKKYIDTDLLANRHTIALTELATQLNMSISKMQRAFKAEFSQTIGEYITQQRLKAARLALEEGQLTIGEAAFLAGYKHASNFCLAYKKVFGVTPGSAYQSMPQTHIKNPQ